MYRILGSRCSNLPDLIGFLERHTSMQFFRVVSLGGQISQFSFMAQKRSLYGLLQKVFVDERENRDV